MKTLIFEPYASGHRLHFVRIVAEAFLEIGIQPSLATTDAALGSPQAEVHLASVIDQLKVDRLPACDSSSRWQTTSQQSAWLADVLTRMDPGKLLIPTASQFADVFLRWCLTPRIWPKNVSIEGLFLGPGFGYHVGSWKRRLLKQLHLRVASTLPFDRYFHLDSHQLQVVRRKSRRPSDHFVVMPDPAPVPGGRSKLKARGNLQIPTHGKYALLAGGITAQKGAVKLLEAIQASDWAPASHARILLAGRCDDEVRQWLRDHVHSSIADRVVVLDRHLSDQELDDAFAASDLLLALQSGRPGSSGTVVRAVAAGLPVMVGAGGWAERITKQFQLGSVVTNLEPEPLAKSLLAALAMSGQYAPSTRAKRLADFATEANFAAHWTRLTREQLGMDHASIMLWQDVVREGG